jgi:hypothetical protein
MVAHSRGICSSLHRIHADESFALLCHPERSRGICSSLYRQPTPIEVPAASCRAPVLYQGTTLVVP